MTGSPDDLDKMELQPDGSRTWRGSRFVQDAVGAWIMQPESNPSSTPPLVTRAMVNAGLSAVEAAYSLSDDDIGKLYLAMHAARSNQEATPDAEAITRRAREIAAEVGPFDEDERAEVLAGNDDGTTTLSGYMIEAVERALTTPPVQEATRTVGDAVSTLFDAIKHGDDEHRDWLKEAIDAHFAGQPVPAVRGGSRKEARIAELEALLAARSNQEATVGGLTDEERDLAQREIRAACGPSSASEFPATKPVQEATRTVGLQAAWRDFISDKDRRYRVTFDDVVEIVEASGIALSHTPSRGWQLIETAHKIHEDGQPPILTWSALHGYGLTYGPAKSHGYGHQTHWQPLPVPPLTPPGESL